ncbi:MAG: ceramidase domain-containing protein [Acidobacteria bacterium]|nr:ceramidase domain-containing protein [Acidobacteriota bacterium]
MEETKPQQPGWREMVLIAIIVLSFAAIFFIPKFGQDPAYHDFADQRPFLGIPNFLDVASNLAFLIVGILGLRACFRTRAGIEWTVLFVGVALVSVGSGWYHWNPNNGTLVWDRLPMTIGFMGLFVALLSEHVGERLRMLLIPALLTGAASVFYWYYFDDLRFYAWVQVVPLLTVPLVLIIFPGRFSHRWLLLVALVFYVAAKLTETWDDQVFAATGSIVSGHTIKHLLSAIGVLAIWQMIRERRASPM